MIRTFCSSTSARQKSARCTFWLAVNYVFALSLSSVAQLNFWTKPSSGNWEEPFWSLGSLPSSTQSVMIVNSGYKAVAINPPTPLSFPNSLTVKDLTVRGNNTLLLNYFGQNVPLRVTNGVTVADSGRILNLYSGLVVEGGTVGVTNAEIAQDGGLVRMTNAGMYLRNASYQLTNGIFEGGFVVLGWPEGGNFNQYGGTATITDLQFGRFPGAFGSGKYSLYGGTLITPGQLRVISDNSSTDEFFQSGGTNQAAEIVVASGLFGAFVRYTLNGGLVSAGSVSVFGGGSVSDFVQNGGTNWITNNLQMIGDIRAGFSIRPATYRMNGGNLFAQSLDVHSYGRFIQSNGLTSVSERIWFGDPGFVVLESSLHGGALQCANVASEGIGSDFLQTGGAFFVTNLLLFGGESLYPPSFGEFVTFTFNGGTLTASNIEMQTTMLIGSSAQVNRITNAGSFKLGFLLRIGDAEEQLGRFAPLSNATIDLAGNASKLTFADSHNENWPASATLSISNWNGAQFGGGVEQLKFGTNQFGLTPAQLGQIHIWSGNPPDEYTARLLNSGEIVPDKLIPPTLGQFREGENTVLLYWRPGWSLQSSTNVRGPYVDVGEANNFRQLDPQTLPQQFFRLLRNP